MQCEVCGHQIFGVPVRSIIEGAKMTVCARCAKLGSGYWEPKPQVTKKKTRTFQPIQLFTKRKEKITVPEAFELASDLNQQVRKAREKLNLSHEDLGRKIREKVSVIRKIESGKLVPDLVLAERLEHALKIKLRIPSSEPKIQSLSSKKPIGTTLGDLIQFKKKEAKK
jgi:putative transcription factor